MWTATLIEAAASIRSFRRRDDDDESNGEGEGPSGDFRGEKLTNATHRSTIGPDARLIRNGRGRDSQGLLRRSEVWKALRV